MKNSTSNGGTHEHFCAIFRGSMCANMVMQLCMGGGGVAGKYV